MSKVLLVKAHPLDADDSYSVRLLEAFRNYYQTKHPEDELIWLDLYKTDIPDLDKSLLEIMKRQKRGDFLFEKEEELLERFNAFSDQLLEVDKIVIANPLWNLQIPSRLLIWINSLNVVKKTFKYTETGPVGLVKGKKLLHIQANGGVYQGTAPGASYIKSIFSFLGVQHIQALYLEGHAYNPKQADVLYRKALEDLEQIINDF